MKVETAILHALAIVGIPIVATIIWMLARHP